MSSNFQSWALSRLRGDEEEDDQPTVRVTLRLDPGEYVEIQDYAKRLDVTKSRLMQQVISECVNELRLVFSVHDSGEQGEAFILGGSDLVDPFANDGKGYVKEAA